MGGQVEFRVSSRQPPADYVKDLRGMAERSKDMRPAFKAIALYLMGSYARNFKAEGRPKWPALAASTIADRRRKGFGSGPILVRTGALRDSLTKPGAPGQHLKITPKTIQFGSNVKYYIFHQYGTQNMPARPMALLQRQDKAQVSRIINTYVREGKVTYKGPTR